MFCVINNKKKNLIGHINCTVEYKDNEEDDIFAVSALF